MLAYTYPLLNIFWTMCFFFLWIMWFYLLFGVFADVFRRRDISGFSKAVWLVFVIILPFLGVFIYLVSQSEGMAERAEGRAAQQAA